LSRIFFFRPSKIDGHRLEGDDLEIWIPTARSRPSKAAVLLHIDEGRRALKEET